MHSKDFCESLFNCKVYVLFNNKVGATYDVSRKVVSGSSVRALKNLSLLTNFEALVCSGRATFLIFLSFQYKSCQKNDFHDLL